MREAFAKGKLGKTLKEKVSNIAMLQELTRTLWTEKTKMEMPSANTDGQNNVKHSEQRAPQA